MFHKILIANRGEIALRIITACCEMGIHTVALYSEADRHALHVQQADEAYFIGPSPASESYLRIDTILDIARRSGAEAIHPGYGFLSENAAFVEACEQAGVVFIGPPAPAMRLMGSKIAAKKLAQSINVPTVPGYSGDDQHEETLLREAERIGFPLLIKASAGGGGKGMREVHQPDSFREELAGARREAQAAFGDATVFLERLIQRPRHVEIQILGDAYGHIIYLGERECSIQRRHQKIIEESPSPALTPALRTEMGEAAVRLAKAAGYVNAGTMEFILDSDKHFYFLEMNTRLQVEHPVTELVTGLDLVRHQILIAAGEPLKLSQQNIQPRGHAIEARLYAEDAARNFLPSTGTLSLVVMPQGPGIRVDSGIESGDEITQYYDPMIGKLIVYGEDRAVAIARMLYALSQTAIFGVITNIPLLQDIFAHPAFQEGLTHTGFLQEHHLTDSTGQEAQLPAEALIAAAVTATRDEAYKDDHTSEYSTSFQRFNNPWKTLGPWRVAGEARLLTYMYHDREYQIALSTRSEDAVTWLIRLDDREPEQVTALFGNDQLVVLRRGEEQQRAYVRSDGYTMDVSVHGRTYQLKRREPPDVEASARGTQSTSAQRTLTAPMAGTLVSVKVREGDQVEAQQVLAILSAMKMEHAITAPHEGRVQRVCYREGDVVPGGAIIIEIE